MRYVILGSGPAGIFAAEAIRKRDPDSPLTAITEEEEAGRSPVMMTYWLEGRENVTIRGPAWAEKNQIDLRTGCRAAAVAPLLRNVILNSGEKVPYDRLLIATGASPILLPVPGANLRGVFSIRRIIDVRAIVNVIPKVKQAVVIGGGFVGLKLAAHFCESGIEVGVLEREANLAPRAFDEIASRRVISLLKSRGVRVETGVEVMEILGRQGRASGVRLKDGRIWPAEIVVQSVGVRPNTEFLNGAGIELRRGAIPVASSMETKVKGIYAAGDVTLAFDEITGEWVNNATWPAAARQGTVAGSNMAGGNLACVQNLPINALHLFGIPLMTAGFCGEEGKGEALREENDRFYRKLVIRDGRLVGFILVGEISRAGYLLGVIKRKELVSDPVELLNSREFQKHLPRNAGYPRISRGETF